MVLVAKVRDIADIVSGSLYNFSSMYLVMPPQTVFTWNVLFTIRTCVCFLIDMYLVVPTQTVCTWNIFSQPVHVYDLSSICI